MKGTVKRIEMLPVGDSGEREGRKRTGVMNWRNGAHPRTHMLGGEVQERLEKKKVFLDDSIVPG
jgi:hypothetical protein